MTRPAQACIVFGGFRVIHSMPRLRTNIIANFLGKGWLAVMSLAFIPVYVSFMGIEAYGLVGFYISLSAVLAFMEFGMGTTLNRELARYTGRGGADVQSIGNLLRTLEVLIWLSALIIASAGAMLAPWLANHWVNAHTLGQDQVALAIWIMVAAIAARLPFSIYSGGLLGLQRQGLYNAILAGGATVKGVGSVVILWAVSPTITAFFAWQLAVELLQSVITAIVLWRALPEGAVRARFGWRHIRSVWRFSAGMMGLSILSPFISQIDRLMVSKMLPLEMMGYYSVACAVAGGIYYIAYPINTAIFPRFSEFIERGAKIDLLRTFHMSCALMSAFVWPIALTLIVFAQEILILWSGDETLTGATADILAVLVVGAVLNAMILTPLTLQHAQGMVKPSLLTNLVMAVLLPVVLYLLIQRYGLKGAALSWVILNAGYFFAYLPITIRLIGRRETVRWLIRDIMQPVVVSVVVITLAKLFFPEGDGWTMAVYLIVVVLVVFLPTLLVSPVLRKNLITVYQHRFRPSVNTDHGA